MMNAVGHAQIGQWYLHRDKGEVFQVIATDERAHHRDPEFRRRRR